MDALTHWPYKRKKPPRLRVTQGALSVAVVFNVLECSSAPTRYAIHKTLIVDLVRRLPHQGIKLLRISTHQKPPTLIADTGQDNSPRFLRRSHLSSERFRLLSICSFS